MARRILHLFLSKWFFVTYFFLGFIFFWVFPLSTQNVSYEKSFFTTLALMTGSDPYTFASTIETYKVSWYLSWIIHVGSWLVIPALIGLMIGEAAERIKQERLLQDATKELLKDAQVPPEKVPHLEANLQKMVNDWVRDAKKESENE